MTATAPKGTIAARCNSTRNTTGVLNNLGVLALKEKRWPLAVLFLQSSLKIDATEAKTHYLLARAEQGNGDLAAARTALAEAAAVAARATHVPTTLP